MASGTGRIRPHIAGTLKFRDRRVFVGPLQISETDDSPAVPSYDMKQTTASWLNDDGRDCRSGDSRNGGGRLLVRPKVCTFPYIYRAAMEVGWDPDNRALFSPKPREWSYLRWFQQIVAAAADEYGVRLVVTPYTVCRLTFPPSYAQR